MSAKICKPFLEEFLKVILKGYIFFFPFSKTVLQNSKAEFLKAILKGYIFFFPFSKTVLQNSNAEERSETMYTLISHWLGKRHSTGIKMTCFQVTALLLSSSSAFVNFTFFNVKWSSWLLSLLPLGLLWALKRLQMWKHFA